MQFRTEINPQPNNHQISHHGKLVLIGSCFAESIGRKLEYYKFPVTVNPFGILFNPVSIANAVRFICDKKLFAETDLVSHDGLWHSFYHHGSFSKSDKQECIDIINKNITDARSALEEASTVVITLGTAFVWEHLQSKIIVSNCHKIPGKQFTQYMLSVEQTEEQLKTICENIFNVNPSATVIFTVSPVRYLIHGAHANQLSKATLLLAIDNVMKTMELKPTSLIQYFPSYELLMDDLRDYRFYADDMVHPSQQAVDYIWEHFADTYFSTETKVLNKKIDAYQKALNHRILNEDSESGRAFVKYIETLREELVLNNILTN